MTPSRRRFIRSSLVLAGMVSVPPAMLASCGLIGRGDKLSEIDYIGSRDGFDRYNDHFKRIRKSRFVFSSFESALLDGSGIVFLDSDSATKSSYIIMLLEQDKDILTTYPLGGSLGDYANISEFREEYGRIVGLLNPLAFYPSIQTLKEIVALEDVSLERIQVNCHPVNLVKDFQIAGPAGTAQPLQNIASYITGLYPVSLQAEADASGELSRIHVRYEDFTLIIRFDREQIGWTMKFTGEDFSALADHTGLLALNNEVEPRHAPDPAVLGKAIRLNMEDFLTAVRDRSEPRVNIIDGLASIMLNRSVEESLKSGQAVNI